MSIFSEKQELRRLHESLERLNILFSRADPDNPEVRAQREASLARRDKLKMQTDGKMKLLLLCMTPRSGSTFFCEALRLTEKLGDPGEWFNIHDGNNLDKIVKTYGAQSREDLLDHIYAQSATDNGVCIVKGDFYQCQPFLYDNLLFRHFDEIRFINVRRQDLLAQAISRFIGTLTGRWASFQESKTGEVKYDRQGIQKQLDYMLAMEEAWSSYFASRAMRPPRITYEPLVKDLPARIEQVARIFDVKVENKAQPSDLRLQKQGSARNARWAKRYATETRQMARKHPGLALKEADIRKMKPTVPKKASLETVKHN